MEITVKKGYIEEHAVLQQDEGISFIAPNTLPENTDQAYIVEKSIEHTIGTKKLEEIIQPSDTIAIVTSDNTRPVPSYIILPVLLKKLKSCGVKEENITIYFARGSHRPQTAEEKMHLVGREIYEHYQCVDSDMEHITHVGFTKQGTPIDIDSRVIEADRRICVGNVEFHYFAGFSGGAKAIMPGMSTPAAIAHNHALMVSPEACAGNLDTNPVRMDLEEAVDQVGVDFIVNIVLNTKKEIIYCASGHVKEAHRDACDYLRSIYLSPIERKADIVIVSQGGAPKDLNLYQMQKAIDNAKYAVKDGGILIVVGSCREGFGNAVFEEWMLKYRTPDEMLSQLQKQFVLGGHKACAIANVRKKADIFIVSDMEHSVVEKTFLKPFDCLQDALDQALKQTGDHPEIIVMPYGGSTLPVIR